MARTKAAPIRRETQDSWMEKHGSPIQDVINLSHDAARFPAAQDGHARNGSSSFKAVDTRTGGGLHELVICAGGIYASFLTWALVQERITTTTYGGPGANEVFDFAVLLNTVQSAFAALTGYIYLVVSSRRSPTTPPLFPTTSIVPPMLLVSMTSSLASPFGYASLKHVGYITFILAKSCKLLPVMALHVSIFRKRYPLYKYAVVALVTSGVAVFTLHHPSSSKKASKALALDASPAWGLFLLSINLLFDGLTNSTQDYINSSFAPYSGSQMMCAQNLISTLLTSAYLLSYPLLASSPLAGPLGLRPTGDGASGGELSAALAFLSRHPTVATDILLFASCGAIGQVFIFYTLSKFSSLLLVTITVTRKMLTMLLSVVWFGHRLSFGQWMGVALVFGGVGAEGIISRYEKRKKEREKRAQRKDI